MNTWWLLLSICWIKLIMERREKDRIRNWRNLIQIQTQTQVQRDHCQVRRHIIECKHITYDPYELKQIRHVTDKHVRHK